MNDQASTLRNISSNRAFNVAPSASIADVAFASKRCARSIAITGGKGGVGKSNVAVNVALELAALGSRVTLLDADLALANADVLLGVNPQFHLGHVLSGQRALDEVAIEVAEGVRLLPGGSGVEELANLPQASQTRMVAELQAMETASRFMIVDTAAGIAANVMGVLRAAQEVVVVTTPDPTAVVDAYATIKVLHNHAPTMPIMIVVNDVVGIGDAEQVFAQLRAAAERFLNHRIEYLGAIPRDEQLAEAVRQQQPVVRYAPGAPASRAFRLIAKHLAQNNAHVATNPRSFWETFAGGN